MVQEGVNTEKLSFIRIRPSYSVKNFNCGDRDLDDFILNRASAFQKHLLAVSYACTDSGTGKILAYCSLANDRVRWTISRIKRNSIDSAKRAGSRTTNA